MRVVLLGLCGVVYCLDIGMRNIFRGVLLFLIVLSIGLFLFTDVRDYFSFSFIAENRDAVLGVVREHLVLSIGVFFVVYVILVAVSFPGAAILTIAAGTLFGLVTGTVIVSFASTIGAACATAAARFVFADTVERRFGPRLRRIQDMVEKNTIPALLALRLSPVFPFFLVNLAMGLTRMRIVPYMVVSMIGMLPGTVLYVYVGRQIADIQSPGDIVSFEVVVSLLLLACFPIVMRRFFKRFKWYAG